MPSSRPTLLTVARLAGVSHMTVSRVVRGERKVKSATVEKVRAAIAQAGYRPDPTLSALAAYRTRGGGQRRGSTMVFLDCDSTSYSASVCDGARAEAERMGYRLEIRSYPKTTKAAEQLSRILFAQGIEGILFGPSDLPLRFAGWRWTAFAVVALGVLNHEPPLHAVGMNYFEGLKRAFAHLQARGCRRIALVVEPHLEARTSHQWLGAYRALCRQPIPVPKHYAPKLLRTWAQRNRVDGVLTIHDEVGVTLEKLGIELAYLNATQIPPRAAHLRLEPSLIGQEGSRLLHSLLLRRELGLPAQPKTVLLRGVWLDAP